MGGDGGDPENAINGGDGEKSAAVKLDTVIANVGSTVVAQESGVPKPNPTQNLPNNQEQALDQAGATTCPVNNAEVQILAGDIVMSKKTEEIGVVSADLLQFLPVAGNTVKKLIKDEVTVVGRNYSHGEAVSSATQPGKIGLVIDVNKRVDLASSTGAIAHRDIEAQKLKRTQSLYLDEGMVSERRESLYLDDIVTSDRWIGVVTDIQLRVKVRLENGREIVRLTPDLKEDFKPVYANRMERSIKHPYYTGQAIDCFIDDGTKRGYVVEQEVQNVSVFWLMTHSPEMGEPEPEPDKVLKPTDLFLLKIPCRDQARWRIGEPCSLDDDQVYLIVNLRTRVRVRWQDGFTDEVDGLQVVPLDNAKALFFCGQLVFKKAERDNNPEFGHVTKVVGDEACVKWIFTSELVMIEELDHHDAAHLNGCVVVAKDTYPHYGMILEQRDGQVELAWVDGSVSMVSFNEIEPLPYAVGQASNPDMDEDDSDVN